MLARPTPPPAILATRTLLRQLRSSPRPLGFPLMTFYCSPQVLRGESVEMTMQRGADVGGETSGQEGGQYRRFIIIQHSCELPTVNHKSAN